MDLVSSGGKIMLCAFHLSIVKKVRGECCDFKDELDCGECILTILILGMGSVMIFNHRTSYVVNFQCSGKICRSSIDLSRWVNKCKQTYPDLRLGCALIQLIDIDPPNVVTAGYWYAPG